MSSSITSVKEEECKKVPTKDLADNENGFLQEMFVEGDKTLCYLSCAKPGAFKGYHLHRVRGARYVCVKDEMKIILYVGGVREEHIRSLSAISLAGRVRGDRRGTGAGPAHRDQARGQGLARS